MSRFNPHDGASADIAYRLVRRSGGASLGEPSAEQQAAIRHDRGRLKLVAGPGTGKTATLVECVADRVLRRGIDPSSIAVLTFSRRAAQELTQRISARLDITVAEPLVRTLHSYAYALLCSAAAASGTPAPRLLEAGQADLRVRTMLAGHLQDGGGYWPAELHAALGVKAFASELREVLLRTAERRITPAQIARLARQYARPEWEAVARFIDEYRDIADLRTGTARLGAELDQAELMSAALAQLDDPAVLSREQTRVRRIFVDEYQDVDPAQAEVIERLASGADELIVVGDPDQSIYGFRGSLPGALEQCPAGSEVALTASHRLPEAIVAGSRRVADRLPLRRRRMPLTSTRQGNTGRMDVRILHSDAQQAAWVADEFRRAHLVDGVAWSDMAVLLRSPAGTAEPFRRAFGAVGIPMAAAAAGSVAEEPVVAALLTVLRAAVPGEDLNGRDVMQVLSSPLGGMDPLALRRARRAIRASPHRGSDAAHVTSQDLLAEVVLGGHPPPADMAEDLATPLRHVARLIELARGGIDEPAGETVLWQIWNASGLAESLPHASRQGGRDGSRADVALDAVMDLFDRAAQVADQLPSAGVGGVLEVLRDEHIAGANSPRRPVDAVAILSAHAAKGLEWSIVSVAGVQQETWPDLRPRANLLRLEELLDAAAGMPVAPPVAARLADERRLFYVATTRASSRLLVSAVDDSEHSPSRFIQEIVGAAAEVPTGWPRGTANEPRRGLQLPALVAHLRQAVTQDDADRARRAARGLGILAEAGIPPSQPQRWYGLLPVSSMLPPVASDAEVVLSPSQVSSARECPLRTVLERRGGRSDPQQAQLLGIAVHALAEGMAAGATEDDLDAALDEFLSAQDHLPPWEVARMRRRMTAMRQALESWITGHAHDRVFLGSELGLDVPLPEGGPRPVRLRGRVDWLSSDSDGRPVITDFKTGSAMPTVAEARDHPQLAAYQLAVALGALADYVGAEHVGAEHVGAEHVGAERAGAEHVGAERAGAEHVGPAEPDVTEPDVPEPDVAESDVPEPDVPEPDVAESDVPEPAGTALGGAELVFVRDGTVKLREQPAQTAEQREQWVGALRDVAEAISGARLVARQGSYCDRCPVRASCPLQPEGRQVVFGS